ncbi:DUF4221 domain-containing protein [Echinicola soli]|uniref:DUF4221 domain-containing protein n=1 Tax=Echinicola soli TaxID=2591634 RepID=A0A514CEE4_9BACT|nr:DUF4221 family protein [Echinicola soli]QDH78202.1 DUF4221 domain-containing protein [Echinicola soli]
MFYQFTRYITCFLLASFLFSCNSKSDNNNAFTSGTLTDLVKDTLYLEKDINTQWLGTDFTYLEKGGKKLLCQFNDRRLLVYDYTLGDLLSAQSFEEEGPNGIGSFISGSLISQDSMLVLSGGKQLIIADHGGKVLSRHDLPTHESTVRGSSHYATFVHNPIHLKGNKVTVTDVPFVLKAPMLEYEKWLLKYDLETGEEGYVRFTFPEKYEGFLDDSEFCHYSHAYSDNKKEHYVSFAADDKLLCIKDGKRVWVDAGSEEPMEFLRGTTEKSGEYIVFNPNPESSQYGTLQYSPWHKVLVRAVKLGMDLERQVESRSFIVLDERLAKTAELTFTSDEFSALGFFTPNGFYLKLAQQQSDDKIGYARIVLPGMG